MVDTPDEIGRRSFLQWATAVGLASTAPTTVAAVAQDTGEGPPDDLPVEPADVDRDGDVRVTHPSELASVRDRVGRASRAGDPSEKFEASLERALASEDREQYDLQVRTAGEPATVVTERRGRQYDGWAPRTDEVRRLSRFGDVEHVPEFTSTKVSLYDVAEEDVAAVADLPFVLTVGSVGHLEDPMEPADTHPDYCEDEDREWVDISQVRSDDVLGFEPVDERDYLSADVKIGVIDTGYNRDGPHAYTENYAEPYLDEDLADGYDTSWDEDGYTHGAVVANTIVFCLGHGHEDMIVPMPYGDSEADTRAAIEYATRHDLDVLNMSLGWTANDVRQCQSTFCDELAAYAAGGNVAVASAGNNGSNDDHQVDEPGASLYDVAVGGVHGGDCSGDGFEADADSSWSDPAVYTDESACEFCYDRTTDEQFLPDVYGAFAVGDESEDRHVVGTTGSRCFGPGTSFAAPEFAAAAALLKEHGLDSYWDVRDAARAQDRTNVCPDERARAGQLLHANDVLGHAPPTPPVDPRVEWASDTAVKFSWDPAHSPGEPDVYVYFVTYSSGGSGASWSVYAPETSIVVDGLADGQEYDMHFSAGDDWGNQSEHPGPEVVVSTPASEDLIAEIDPQQTEGSAGETAYFDVTDQSDGSWITDLYWEFDDGGASDTGWHGEHTYEEPGTYWVTLEATNADGETTTAALEFTVT